VTQLLLRFETGWNEGSAVAEKLLIIDGDLAIAGVVGLVADAHSMDGATHAGQTLDASNNTFHSNAFKPRLKRCNRIVALATCGALSWLEQQCSLDSAFDLAARQQPLDRARSASRDISSVCSTDDC
jgi:hypothetical protein